MRGWVLVLVGVASAATYGAVADGPSFLFPQVPQYGGIAATPGAAQPPRRGAQIVFDIVAESGPQEVNKGLESVARYLNLHAHAGFAPSDAKLALVLHGGAMKAALQDAAYAEQTKGAAEHNPNLELIGQLKASGVEVFVCGQSLARSHVAPTDVARDVVVAVSAMTVTANKQQDGYSYITIR